jgi:hypothetical protein
VCRGNLPVHHRAYYTTNSSLFVPQIVYEEFRVEWANIQWATRFLDSVHPNQVPFSALMFDLRLTTTLPFSAMAVDSPMRPSRPANLRPSWRPALADPRGRRNGIHTNQSTILTRNERPNKGLQLSYPKNRRVRPSTSADQHLVVQACHANKEPKTAANISKHERPTLSCSSCSRKREREPPRIFRSMDDPYLGHFGASSTGTQPSTLMSGSTQPKYGGQASKTLSRLYVSSVTGKCGNALLCSLWPSCRLNAMF